MTKSLRDRRIMGRGGHMIRVRLFSGGMTTNCIVGLGIFKPHGHIDFGTGACCDPRCGGDEEVWAAWLWNGKLVVLPFCLAHAREHLLLDERAEAEVFASAIRSARAAARGNNRGCRSGDQRVPLSKK